MLKTHNPINPSILKDRILFFMKGMSSIPTECSTDTITLDKIYNEGFKEGYKECRNSDYHSGYKHGYRDACEDRYWIGWYSGLMVGTLTGIIGGMIIYTTNKKSRISPF
jgi:hypothetical protein